MNEIKKQCNSVKRVEPEINLEWLKNLHIAHEFYHFLEFSQDQRTGELLKPVERKGMFRTQKVCLQSVSEIAAHSFAKEYMGADINPKYFDCLYISIENKSYFEKIMNNIETARLLVERSLKMNTIEFGKCVVPVIGSYDTVIVGGGTAGASAGISAAREGNKTIIVEKVFRLVALLLEHLLIQ